MKIGILTYYGVHNHGAVLQANALRRILLSHGHDVTFLKFDRNYDYIDDNAINKYNLSWRSLLAFFNFVKKRGIKSFLYNFRKKLILDRYRKENLPLSVHYSNFDGDLVIIGSDEVFSLEIGFNPALYGIGINCPVISYAGSFGPSVLTEIEEKRKHEALTKAFKKMKSISVRDNNSAKIIESLTKKSPNKVCDPVILYGYGEEMEEYIPSIKDYIVVYSYDKNMNDAEEVKIIRTYAKERKLKIVSVGYYHAWCDINVNVTPNEALGWIKNANLVVTDTFHGSVMSIICNTPFVAKYRGNTNKLRNLLTEYKLNSRAIDSFMFFEPIAQEAVEWIETINEIETRRKDSMDFLKKSISNK